MEKELRMNIINTDGSIGMDISAQKVYPSLEDLEVTPSSVEQEFTHPDSYGYDHVVVKAVASDDLDITPTTESQQYVGLYGKVDVGAVTSSIDENIVSGNIKNGVSILGVNGSVNELIPEEINVTPTTSSQTITPSANKTGITQVNVSAVDNTIDSDITSNNIRQGVDILGVTGNVVELQGETRETTPTEQTQVITPNENKNGITQMTVNPIPSQYIVPTGTKTITENGITDVKNYANANVAVPMQSIPEKDVNFYDYDGTLLASYTTQEALAFTEMPSLPSHSGLTCQGWNFTLQQMKDYLNDCPWVDIGAMYITNNGHTRLYMTLTDSNILTMPFELSYLQNGYLTVNWGDGTSDTITTTGITNHTWQINNFPANVVIDIEYTGTGTFSYGANNMFNGNQYFSSCLTKAELGNGNTFNLGNNYGKFMYCCAMETITIPYGVEGFKGNSFFRECNSLKCIVIPNSFTGTGQYSFDGCVSARNIILPNTINTSSTQCFNNVASAKRINLPRLLNTSVDTGFFGSCRSLEKIKLPNGVTTIGGQSFASCYSLKELNIPSSVTSIGVASFVDCRNLKEINIPSGLTSLGGQQAFNGCWSITKLKIPSAITSFGQFTFQNCKSLMELDLSEYTSVPTLSNVNAFTGTPENQIIWVKDQSMLTAFSTASNWTNFASRFQIKP